MITMASKRRVRKKSCLEKKRYATKAEAEVHAARLRQNGSGQVDSYHCSFGDHWHVGHVPLSRLEYPDFGKEKH